MPVMARPLQRYRRPFFGGGGTALNLFRVRRSQGAGVHGREPGWSAAISSLTALHDEGHLSLPVRYAGRVLSAIRDAIAWVSHSYGVRLQDATPASRAALAEDASGLRMMTLSRPGVHVRRWCTDKRTAWIAGLGG